MSRIAALETLESRLLMSSSVLPELSRLAAQPIDISPTGSIIIDGQLANPGQAELYAVTPEALARFDVDMSSGDMDTFLRIYDSRGRRLAGNNNAARGTTDSHLSIKLKAGKTYYIRTAAADEAAGSYSLNLRSFAYDDYHNTLATADNWSLSPYGSGTLRGTMNYGRDGDVLKIVATKTGQMQIDMRSATRRSMLNCELAIYDSNGVQIVANDNAGGTLDSSVRFDAEAGKTYYVLAYSHDGSTGRYTLRAATVQKAPTPPPPPPPTPNPDPNPPEDVVPPADPDYQLAPGATISGHVVSTQSGLQLVVLGTDQADVITLSQTGGRITLTTSAGATNFDGTFSTISIYGFGGDDVIRISNSVSIISAMYGGSGNDNIFCAGTAADILLGEDGNDLLVSVGGSADNLIGGAGLDSVWKDSADAMADASSAEDSAASVHSITEFYQPYTSDKASAKYVSLEIAGQNLVDPTINGYAGGYANFASRPLFADSPEFSDIEQGALGDCYLLASLASLTQSDPTVIEQMIAPLGDGTYAVRFYRGGKAVYLRIDADLPVSRGQSLAYATLGSDNELWVPLIEKAYAYFRYAANSYGSIEGGWMGTVYQEITNVSAGYHGTSGSSSSLVSYMMNQLAAGHAVTLASKATASGPIVSNHAYMLEGVESTADGVFVTVYNPWGIDGKNWDSNSNDGLLRLPLSTFQAQFVGISVCMV